VVVFTVVVVTGTVVVILAVVVVTGAVVVVDFTVVVVTGTEVVGAALVVVLGGTVVGVVGAVVVAVVEGGKPALGRQPDEPTGHDAQAGDAPETTQAATKPAVAAAVPKARLRLARRTDVGSSASLSATLQGHPSD